MKHIRFLLFIVLFQNAYAQQNLSLSIYQDAKFAFKGDEKRGYKAGTLDLIFRLKMKGHQKEHGYLVVFPEFEYADLKGTYRRYSLNAGYTFNKIIKSLEPSIFIGWGFIDRFNYALFSYSFSGEIAHRVTNNFSVLMLAQFTERKDLKLLYDNNQLRFSGFIGIEYNFL